ncbi:hypothetical protein D3C76_1806200 [compost metagenome]
MLHHYKDILLCAARYQLLHSVRINRPSNSGVQAQLIYLRRQCRHLYTTRCNERLRRGLVDMAVPLLDLADGPLYELSPAKRHEG